MKRFDIGTVFRKSVAGGHPKEALEASFDIVQDETSVQGCHIEAEALIAVCQVMSLWPKEEGKVRTTSVAPFFHSLNTHFSMHLQRLAKFYPSGLNLPCGICGLLTQDFQKLFLIYVESLRKSCCDDHVYVC